MNTRKKVIKTVYKDEDDSEAEKAAGDFSDSGSDAQISDDEDHYSSEDDHASDGSAEHFQNTSRKSLPKPNFVRKTKFAKDFISKIQYQPSSHENEDVGSPMFSVKDLTEADKLLPSVLNLSESDSSDDEAPKPIKKTSLMSTVAGANNGSDGENETTNEYKDVWSKNIEDSEEVAKRTFQQLEQHKTIIEETKATLLNYSAKSSNHREFDVKDLLAQGEKVTPKLDMPVRKGKNDKNDSDSEMEDWEEVNDAKPIPQQGLQLIVDFPDAACRKTKKLDIEMMMKRKINRVKKEYQVYMHKVHVLCWLGHGNYVSRVLNDQDIMAAALSLVPSKECYPGERVDMKYVEQITTWFRDKLTLKPDKNEDKFKPKAPPLKQILLAQIKSRIVTNKKYLVFLFVSMLRAIGLQCRVMFNFVTLPIKPPSTELCSLSTKPKEKESKKEENTSEKQKETKGKGKKSKTSAKPKISQVDGADDELDDMSDDEYQTISQLDGNDDKLSVKPKSRSTRNTRTRKVEAEETLNDDVSPPKRARRSPTPKIAQLATTEVTQEAQKYNESDLSEKEASTVPKRTRRLPTPKTLDPDTVSSPKKEKKSQAISEKSNARTLPKITRKSPTPKAVDPECGSSMKVQKSQTVLENSEALSKRTRKSPIPKSVEPESRSATKKVQKSTPKISENSEALTLPEIRQCSIRNIIETKTTKDKENSSKTSSGRGTRSRNPNLKIGEKSFNEKRSVEKDNLPKPPSKARKSRTAVASHNTDQSKEIFAKKETITKEESSNPKTPSIIITDESNRLVQTVESKYFDKTNSKKLSLSRKRSLTTSPDENVKSENKAKTKPRTKSAETKKSKYFNDTKPDMSKKSRLSLKKPDDLFEDNQRVSHRDLLAKSKVKSKNDVTGDLVNIIKTRVKQAKEDSKLGIVKGKLKPDSDADSDYLPEQSPKRVSESDEDFKPTKISPKPSTSGRSRKVDRRVLSSDDDTAKNKVDVWCEVYVEELEQWISVDVIKGKVHCTSDIYKNTTHPVCYVIGWDNNNYLKDLTRRYVPHWNTVTRKQRAEPAWWDKAVEPWLGPKTARDKEEDEQLNRMQLEAPLPTSIGEYKNHPLYALKRHLLKFEALYPPDAAVLGFVRKEPVYARECVYVCRSRDTWLKEAKVVRLGETPYKVVKARPKWDRLSNKLITDKPLEVFGPWQVDDYEPPTAENGLVPRNAYGNVELFKDCMLPKGTAHIKLPGLNRVAKKLNIDCAPAMTGFDFNGGWSHPVYDGFVVCKEFEEIVTQAWLEDQEEQERKEREKLETRVYGNWRRLIKGLLIRERVKTKYGFSDPEPQVEKKKKGPRFVAKKK